MLSGGDDWHRSHLVLMGLRNPSDRARASFVALADFLADRGIRVSQRQGRLRFSFHFYNTEDEVRQVLAAVGDWAKDNRIPLSPERG